MSEEYGLRIGMLVILIRFNYAPNDSLWRGDSIAYGWGGFHQKAMVRITKRDYIEGVGWKYYSKVKEGTDYESYANLDVFLKAASIDNVIWFYREDIVICTHKPYKMKGRIVNSSDTWIGKELKLDIPYQSR